MTKIPKGHKNIKKNVLKFFFEWFSITNIDPIVFMKMLWPISAHWCFQKIIGSGLALWWSDTPRSTILVAPFYLIVLKWECLHFWQLHLCRESELVTPFRCVSWLEKHYECVSWLATPSNCVSWMSTPSNCASWLLTPSSCVSWLLTSSSCVSWLLTPSSYVSWLLTPSSYVSWLLTLSSYVSGYHHPPTMSADWPIFLTEWAAQHRHMENIP